MICVQKAREEDFVLLMDADWADDWAMVHGVEVPHHAQRLSTKEKFSQTKE